MKAGKTKEEIMATEELPGFPEYRAPKPNRLSANFDVAYQELGGK